MSRCILSTVSSWCPQCAEFPGWLRLRPPWPPTSLGSVCFQPENRADYYSINCVFVWRYIHSSRGRAQTPPLFASNTETLCGETRWRCWKMSFIVRLDVGLLLHVSLSFSITETDTLYWNITTKRSDKTSNNPLWGLIQDSFRYSVNPNW